MWEISEIFPFTLNYSLYYVMGYLLFNADLMCFIGCSEA